MSMYHHRKPHLPRIQRTPDPQVQATFKRMEEENPDLPIEDILQLTASHLNLTPSTTIAALWG